MAVINNTPLTKLQMARLLRLGYRDSAETIASGLKYGYPSITALEMATILLDGQIEPNLRSTQMEVILRDNGGYSYNDYQAAINTLYQVENITLGSNAPWISTNFTATPTNNMVIAYTGGNWNASPYIPFCDGTGVMGTNGKSGYAMPGVPEGALIARIGGTAVYVGNFLQVPSYMSGPISLCINDDVGGEYGNGYHDNQGAIQVHLECRR